MRFWFRFLTVSVLLYFTLGEEINESLALKEQVKLLSIQLKALNTKHNMEVQALKKEIAEIRSEMTGPIPTAGTAQGMSVSPTASPNQRRNSVLTMRWLQSVLGELRGEMAELENSFNTSEFTAEQQRLRNELSVMFNEAANVAQQVESDGARISKIEVQVEQAANDLKQIREFASEAQITCGRLEDQLKSHSYKSKHMSKLPKRASNYPNDEMDYTDSSIVYGSEHSQKKTRHLHFLRKQVSDLARTYHHVALDQQEIKSEVLSIQNMIQNGDLHSKQYEEMQQKLEHLISENQASHQNVSNLSREISSFNKLHVSMLELLESVESLENKIDKTIPDVQKEISRLDVAVAQIISQNAYLKEDQENIRQSVKAIAVSVSNTADKVNEDHRVLVKINDTTDHLRLLSNQHFYRLNDHILKSESTGLETNISASDLPELVNEIEDLREIEKQYENVVNRLPYDCSTVDGAPGVYLIAPGVGAPIKTFCENKQTLLQVRFDGSVEFNRPYRDYAAGFGFPTSEFWIGNDALHRLTQHNCSSLSIDMTDIYGKKWFANYTTFSVGSESEGYRLRAGGFSGNASDALEYQNNMEFSTIDHDRDISNTHCAANYEGGWWFSHCQHVNLNGKYTLGLTWFDSTRNEWIAIASSKLTLFRQDACDY